MNKTRKEKYELAKKRSGHLLLVLALLAYSLLLTNPESSAARTLRTSHQSHAAITNSSQVQNSYLQPGGIKVLAEGFHSKITEPFVAVVRDLDSYAALAKLDESLPKLDADFFQDNAVLAAFLGTRSTGGYSVEISPSPVDINILEKKPAKGMMQTQMITAPFKVVALQGVGNEAVRINPDEAWRQRIQSYRTTSARFRMTGGFAGTSEEFELQGVIGVMRQGDLASFIFRLVSSKGKRRLLMESSTGLIGSDKTFQISRLSADSLINPPTNGLAGMVTFSEKGRKLTLSLSSRPTQIADGYEGQGTIEAELVGSAEKP